MWFRYLAIAAMLLLGCGGAASKQAEPTLEATTRVGDTLGVVVRYLCDQAEGQAVAGATSQADYEQRVGRIRQVCNPVADAYDALADAQLAAVNAAGVVDRCAVTGAQCLTEWELLTGAFSSALSAASAAQQAAQGVPAALQAIAGGDK